MTTLAKTLGELKRTAYRSLTVRAEIRANLRRKLADAGLQNAAIKTETGIGFRLVEL